MIKKTTKIGILGKSIQYSLSPIIHEYWLKQNKINGKYEIFDIQEKDIKVFMQNLVHKNIKGLNVTIPYKNKIIKYLDDVSPASKAIGAVNTIKVNKNGMLYGDNTDAKGFIKNLEKAFPNWIKIESPIVVVGAGGAARAIIYSLINSNKSEVRIVNRNKKRANNLIKDIKKIFPYANINFFEEYNNALKGVSFLINTSSLGMVGYPDLNVDLSEMKRNSIVYDIVYSPLETNLLKQAKKLDFLTINGLGMLLEQAAPAFNAWFNKNVKVTKALKEIVIKEIENRQ